MMASSQLVLNILAVDKASKTLGGIGKSIGGLSAAGAAASGALIAFGVSSVKAFSDSEAAQLKLNDAFDKFPRLSDTNTSALNRLNSEIQKKTRFDDEALATGEATLAQFDLTGQQITDLIPLVADFAAKTGTDIPDAASKIGKALLGQGRALKAVGINFTDTGSVAGNLTQIMGGLRSQVGGFAEKEGNTAAGKAAILKNQFNDLQEQVGGLLVPAMGLLVSALTPLVSAFGSLPSPVQKFAFALVGIAGTALILAPRIATAIKALTAFRTALALTMSMTNAFNVSLLAALGSIGLVVVAVGALVGAVGLVVSSMDAQNKIVEQSADTWDQFYKSASPQGLIDLQNELTPAQRAVEDWSTATSFADGVSDRWNRGVTALSSVFRNSNTVLEQATDDTHKMNQAQKDIADVIDRTAIATGKSKDEVKMLADKYKIDLTNGVNSAVIALSEKTTATDKEKVAAAKAAMANGDLVTESARLKNVADDAKGKIDALKEAINRLNGKTIDLAEAQDNSQGAFNRANQAIKDNGGKLSGTSDKAIAARNALRDYIRAKQDEAVETEKATGKTGDANKVLKTARDRVDEVARKWGLSKTEVGKYKDALKNIPKKKTTTAVFKADVSGLNSYERELLGLYMQLPKSSQIAIALGVPVAGAKAKGGPVKANQAYIVGEKRPELFVPSTNGVILPNLDSIDAGARGVVTSKQSTSGTAGNGIVIQGGTFIGASKQDVARWMSDIIREGKSRGLVMS
jgi:hypothetical protein